MAASKPTSWLSVKFHLLKCTEYEFRDLRLRSGLFPFRPQELRPLSLTAKILTNWYSEFDKKDEVSPYSFFPVLYPQWELLTPALKLFRREPAITEFVWLFTPYHRSSDDVARQPVRSSHVLSNVFNLPMVSSSRFGSTA